MQINLGTRDLTVAEEIANRDEVDAFANQVRGKGVTQPMRTQRLCESRAPPECADVFIERSARELPLHVVTERMALRAAARRAPGRTREGRLRPPH